MAINEIQDASGPVAAAAFVDDDSGARVQHMAANSRNLTTLMLRITRTSPGVVSGLGGDNAVTIPGGAIPTGIRLFSALEGSTGATVSLGLDNVTSNHFLSGYSVATLAAGRGQLTPNGATNLHVALPLMALGQAHTIVGRYAETATSPGGGPFYFEIDYYLPDPA